jgi:O-antigen/teichoic acid export membrane protein
VTSLSNLLTRLGRLTENHHTRELVRGASAAFAVKVLAAGVAFALNIVIARELGAAASGLYFLSLTVTTIAAVIGRIGLDRAVLRYTAASAATDDWSAVNGVVSRALSLALLWSSLTAVTTFLLAPIIAVRLFNEPALVEPLRWMALSILPLSLYTIYSQALKGLKRVADAMAIQGLWTPAVTLGGILLLAPRWGVAGAVGAYAAATFVNLTIAYFRWRRAAAPWRKVAGVFPSEVLLATSFPLFWVALLQLTIVWSSNLMLGIWADTASVAIFSVANRTAQLTSLVLIAVNSIAAPKFAALYQQGDMEELGRTARNAAKLMAVMSSPALLVILVVPGPIMGLFGDEFRVGSGILTILAAGQFINVVSGSVAYLLMMTGLERQLRNILAMTAALNLGLNFMLTPKYGILGAAVANSVSMAVQNLTGVFVVYREMGIITLPFIPWRPRAST